MSEETGYNSSECECAEALERLCEFLDAEMPESDLSRVRAHIENCDECLDALSSERSLRVVLRRSCTEVAPASLRFRVLSQITVLRTTARH